MAPETTYERVTSHIDTAVCIAIESPTVYSEEDLTAILHRVWNERSTEGRE